MGSVIVGAQNTDRTDYRKRGSGKGYLQLQRSRFDFGGDSFKETYLLSDIVPCYKYHLIQEWHAGFTEKVRNEIHDTYADGDAKWILTDGDAELIADVLESRYEVEGQLDSYTLYHLK